MDKIALTLGELAGVGASTAVGGVAGYHKGGLKGALRGAAGAGAGSLAGSAGGGALGGSPGAKAGIPVGALAGYKASTYGMEDKKKEAGMLHELWDAANTPIPGTPKLLAGRNLGALKGEATNVVKKAVAPVQKTKEQVMAARRASYRPTKTASFHTFVDEVEKLAYEFEYGELSKLASELNIGQWWEHTGGPHLAKGGSIEDFQKKMHEAGIPAGKQERLMKSAKSIVDKKKESRHSARPASSPRTGKYTEEEKANANEYNKTHGSEYGRTPTMKDFLTPSTMIGAAAAIGLGGYILGAKSKTDEVEKPNKLKGRIGSIASTGLGLATAGAVLGSPSTKGRLIGALVGGVLGSALGEAHFRDTNKRVQQKVTSILRAKTDGPSSKQEEEAKVTPAGFVKKHMLHATGAAALLGVATGSPIASAAWLGAALGEGALKQYEQSVIHERVNNAKEKRKVAFTTSEYSTPIEGPKVARQESSLPFRPAPNLRHPMAKEAFNQGQYGSTGGFVDFHQVSSIPGFKRPSLATAIEKKSDFNDMEPAEKDKRAGVMTQTGSTPAAMLSSAKRIGAPKVTSPSGPSIGDIAKPKGFGMKIPGATLKL